MHVQATTSRPAAKRDSRAFTAMEMILALSLTALIALCAFTMIGAAGHVWEQQQDSAAGMMTGTRARSYIERTLRESHDVGYFSSGSPTEPPALLLWAEDLLASATVSAGDHQVQRGELLLIRYDASAQKLMLFRRGDWSGMSAAQQAEASALVSASSFSLKSTADAFAQCEWVQAHVLAGAAAGEKVLAAWFAVDRSASGPVVTFRFEIERSGQAHVIYGTASLRVRSKSDNWTVQILESGS